MSLQEGAFPLYDILIKNGNLIDGTGSPAMKAQVAVKDGKIIKIARHIDGDAKPQLMLPAR